MTVAQRARWLPAIDGARRWSQSRAMPDAIVAADEASRYFSSDSQFGSGQAQGNSPCLLALLPGLLAAPEAARGTKRARQAPQRRWDQEPRPVEEPDACEQASRHEHRDRADAKDPSGCRRPGGVQQRLAERRDCQSRKKDSQHQDGAVPPHDHELGRGVAARAAPYLQAHPDEPQRTRREEWCNDKICDNHGISVLAQSRDAA